MKSISMNKTEFMAAPETLTGANSHNSLTESIMNNFTEKFNLLTVAFNPNSVQFTEDYINITGKELWKKLKEPRIGDKNGAHFLRTSLKNDINNFCLSRTEGNCIESASLIIIDVDEATAPPVATHLALKKANLAHILVGTHSYYAANKNRYRILLLTDSTYSKDQLEPTSESIVETINCNLANGFIEYAKENKVYSQSWFTPSMPNNCDKEILYFEYTEGLLFPVKNKKIEPAMNNNKQPSISLQAGQISPISAWNEQIPISQILEENGYKLVFRSTNTSRWLSPDSTSLQGGVIENLENNRIYSFHNDCLNDGYSHDSFDTMRLLKGLTFDDAIKLASQQIKAPDGNTIDEYNKNIFSNNQNGKNTPKITFTTYQPFNNDLLPVEKIPYESLPINISDFIKEQSQIRGCPEDFILVSLLARMGCVFSGKIQVSLTRNTGWVASPNSFWAMIGDPSSGKSNALKSAKKFTTSLTELAQNKYKQDQQQYIQDKELLECKIQAIKKGIEAESKKATVNANSIDTFEKSFKDNMQKLAELEDNKPILKQYKVAKTTVERLLVILQGNPDGIMLELDELSAFLVKLSKDDNADERGLYLSGFNGDLQYTYDTINRGTVFIPRLILSVFGGIQPSKLKRFLNEARIGYQDDGLIQRFQGVVYPDKQKKPLEDKSPSIDLTNRISQLFNTIDCLPSDTILRFNDEAQQIMDEWREKTQKNAALLEHPLEAHLIKSYEFVASLAVYIYLADNNGKITSDKLILPKQLIGAIKLGNYFFTHAKRMYGLVYKDNLPARALAEKIVKLAVSNSKEHYDSIAKLYFFTKSQIRTKDWADLSTKEERREAIEVLIKLGHIAKSDNGRFYINPEHLNEENLT